MTSLLGN